MVIITVVRVVLSVPGVYSLIDILSDPSDKTVLLINTRMRSKYYCRPNDLPGKIVGSDVET